MQTALLLIAIFSASFLTTFLAIFFTQSAYSMPSRYILVVEGLGSITIGPPPNSANIPLDTTIIIDIFTSTGVSDLHITPDVPIARVTTEVSGMLTFLNTFYPAQPLKPATTYNVSATIMDVPVSWNFTTTSEPFNPTISYYLANNVLWIALATAVSATSVFGFAIWFKRKQQ